MTELASRQGTRNRRAGLTWNQACVRWLLVNGFPSAERQLHTYRSDIAGTWDVAVECTIAGWDKIHIKMAQAYRDAEQRGLAHYCVWKKANGKANPGDGLVVLPAHVFFGLVQRLESAEKKEAV